VQLQGPLVSKQVTITTQSPELHHREPMLRTERVVTVDLTTSQARPKGIAPAISRDGGPCPAFTSASQNVTTVAVLLDTLAAPSADGVDRVYRQLREILTIADARQVKTSIQRRAGVSIPSPVRFRVSWQRTIVEPSMIGTASSSAWVPAQDPPRHSDYRTKS
jgi:hypothetical protein